jgi:WD40 repeat protein
MVIESTDGTDLLDAKTGATLQTLTLGDTFTQFAVLSPDGKFILTGSGNGTAVLWDTQIGKVLRFLFGHRSSVSSGAFSPDGKYLLDNLCNKAE